jgi:small subunit ribosomal protein S9
MATGKRKTAVARVRVTDGEGRVRINNVPIHIHEPLMAREIIMYPLLISGETAQNPACLFTFAVLPLAAET